MLVPIYKGWREATELYQIFMQIALGMVIAGYIYELYREGFTWDSLIKVLLLMGIIARVGHMIYTPARLRGHWNAV